MILNTPHLPLNLFLYMEEVSLWKQFILHAQWCLQVYISKVSVSWLLLAAFLAKVNSHLTTPNKYHHFVFHPWSVKIHL
jgi:hypothetical protein